MNIHFHILLYVYLSLGSPKADFEMRIHGNMICLEVFPGKTGGGNEMNNEEKENNQGRM